MSDERLPPLPSLDVRSSPARPEDPPCEQPEVSDRVMLLAYIASEYHSIAAALNTLADSNAVTRRQAWSAQQEGDVASWAWSLEAGCSHLNPVDRMVEVRKFLTIHVHELAALQERLAL